MTNSARRSRTPTATEQDGPDHWNQLVFQAQTGNRSALDILLNQMLPWLFILVRAAQVNEVDAWDVVQETILRLCQGLAAFDSCRGSFRSWAATIARNQIVDLWRRQARRRVELVPLDELGCDWDDPASRLAREENISLVLDAVNSLKPNERAAVNLRYIDGLGYTELSQALHVPLGTAATRVHRGIKSVRERLRKTA
jgi:RNA polymerase sigma-70 factor (ECF subfamily)